MPAIFKSRRRICSRVFKFNGRYVVRSLSVITEDGMFACFSFNSDGQNARDLFQYTTKIMPATIQKETA